MSHGVNKLFPEHKMSRKHCMAFVYCVGSMLYDVDITVYWIYNILQ